MKNPKILAVFTGEPGLSCMPLPHSVKWRCACGKGKVNAKLNSRCKGCKAVVSKVVKA